MSVKINLNSIIKVRLTDLGRDIYYHRVDDLNEYFGCEKLKPTYPEVDSEGYTKFTLWGFMELYGSHIGMAKPNVIEPIEIICDDAQPEREKGQWLPWEYARPGYEYKFHKCSVCGVCDEYVDEVPRPNGTIARIEKIRNYCPNCGAKMKPKGKE